jgi:hypothetical protein
MDSLSDPIARELVQKIMLFEDPGPLFLPAFYKEIQSERMTFIR